jgi:hypothetical protein
MIRTLAASLALLALAPSASAQLPGLPKTAAPASNYANAGAMTACLLRIVGNNNTGASPLTFGFRYKALEVSNKSPVAAGEWFNLNLSKDKMYLFFLSENGVSFPAAARDPSPGQWDSLQSILANAAHAKVHFTWANHLVTSMEIAWDEPC